MLPEIFKVTCHTRHVGESTIFVAIPGTSRHGNEFIAQAIEKGAKEVIIDEQSTLTSEQEALARQNDVTITPVANPRKSLAALSTQAYENPAQHLKIIGVTGTKGKTTSVYLLHHLLKSAGHKVAMISGVENKINEHSYPAELTTPHPDYLHMFFAECVNQKVEYVVMEASAQAFSLHRLDGILFDATIFTNFSLEHAEFYNSIEEYFEAKCEIFDHCKRSAVRAVNIDDVWARKLEQAFDDLTLFGFSSHAQQPALLEYADMNGLAINIEGQRYTTSRVVGPYNASNLLGVLVVLRDLGVAYDSIQRGLENFTLVPGRLEQIILPSGVRAVIDYAHNPSSFQALFSMLKSHVPHLTVVFGCGGGRDKTKRPMMGELAARYADAVYLTSDNPRNEDINEIVVDIKKGIPGSYKGLVVEVDRARAIRRALDNAPSNGVVAILGKGPDEYQLVGKEKTFFSDKQEVMAAI